MEHKHKFPFKSHFLCFTYSPDSVLTFVLIFSNISGGSIGGIHKSMTRLSSSQQINALAGPSPSSNVTVTSTNKYGVNSRISSGGVTITTGVPPRIQRPHSQGPLTLSTNHNNQVCE